MQPSIPTPSAGDQHFWGQAVHRMGLGPEPIPVDKLTTAKLVAALRFMQRAEVKTAAQAAAEQIGKVCSRVRRSSPACLAPCARLQHKDLGCLGLNTGSFACLKGLCKYSRAISPRYSAVSQ